MTNSTILFYAETPEAESWFGVLADSLSAVGIELVYPITAETKTFTAWLQQVRSRNGISPLALLYLGNLTTTSLTHVCKASGIPVLFAGQREQYFQVGPAVIWGKTACPSCWEQQATYFPITTSACESAETVFRPFLLEKLSPSLTTIIHAFVSDTGNSLLRQGYWQRYELWSDCVQTYRLLKSPYCTDCSIYSQHPSEAIYVQDNGVKQ